jgi:3-methyladenine DNA glycosylase AlkD
MNLDALIQQMNSIASPAKAKDLSWFFKTGKGQYGEGDKFLGIVVPSQRKLVSVYWDVLDLTEVETMLCSQYHEHRLTALMILVKKYQKGDRVTRQKIYNFYLKNTAHINNWDLVDLSSRDIVGAYCYEHKDYSILTKLSRSTDLWEKRISLVSTFFLIKNDLFQPSLDLALTLLSDPHDLIHKAIGWMLREIGKRNLDVLLQFLDAHALAMPRTSLRYAIEKLPETKRQYYLKLK